MRPDQAENLLFRGIPPQPRRGFRHLSASLCIHVIVIGLLVFATPAILVNRRTDLSFNTPLIAPPETPAAPKPAPVRVAVVTPPPAPRPVREFVAPTQPRLLAPKLDDAPALSKVRPPELDLPAPPPPQPIRPPVQTGLFGSNLPARVNPALPVPPVRNTGFDSSAKQAPLALPRLAAAVGAFDTRAAESRPVTTAAAIQTGAFDPASRAPSSSARVPAANVTHTGFDIGPQTDKPAPANAAVRRTSFDEVKAAPTPAARQAASAPAGLRPVEILDKPKPLYTAEARARKIEGDVLLDVIFAATGEVRVLGVTRGLGHGLDENAVDAARRIRFRPATQAGMPVDQRAILHVVFQITG